jgi:hypothetical protein
MNCIGWSMAYSNQSFNVGHEKLWTSWLAFGCQNVSMPTYLCDPLILLFRSLSCRHPSKPVWVRLFRDKVVGCSKLFALSDLPARERSPEQLFLV